MTPSPSSSLCGRHALVTGGGRGMGAAIARQLLAEGASVTLLGRDDATLMLPSAYRLGDTSVSLRRFALPWSDSIARSVRCGIYGATEVQKLIIARETLAAAERSRS